MGQKVLYLLYLLTLGAWLTACGPQEFSTKKNQDKTTTSPIQTKSNTLFSDFTLIKPPVDFLFVWDNSSSSLFINEETKAALNNTINLVSNRFDFRIVLAPLVGTGNGCATLVADNPTGLNSQAQNMLIPKHQAANQLKKMQDVCGGGGSSEAGLSRTAELLELNHNNGILREDAYTLVVIMSNQDDNSYVDGVWTTAAQRNAYIEEQKEKILCLRGHYSGSCSGVNPINSQMMRFISLVPHSNQCKNFSTKANYTYKRMSEIVYNETYTNGYSGPNDGQVPYDSYDICDINDFTHLFDGVNNSIQDTLIKHKYNYWPVAHAGASIDPNEITVTKILPNGSTQNIQRLSEPVPSGATGFTFDNSVQTQNTRFHPSPGEPFTGYLVELHGNAIVTYPEGMRITTQTPKDYYGFIQLQAKPVESTIKLKINGQEIPKGKPNGWVYLSGYKGSQHINILGPNANDPNSEVEFYSPASPTIYKSGYFLQVFGNAVYSNGANIEVTYDPSGS